MGGPSAHKSPEEGSFDLRKCIRLSYEHLLRLVSVLGHGLSLVFLGSMN